MRKRIVIGQAGGPTPVINATLAALADGLISNHDVSYVLNGYEGLAKGAIITGGEAIHTKIADHRSIPGACLGSGRYPSTEQSLSDALRNLRSWQMDTLIMIGGDGTMSALSRLERMANKEGYPLQVIGVPKTVDNDLGGTDHAPGFGSAANYVAQSVLDSSRDLMSMNNFEQVRILETMGRNSGWLAAASGLFCQHEEEGPHVIAIPEIPFDKVAFLKKVDYALTKYGHALAVVSEGVRLPETGSQSNSVNGREVLGGISESLKQEVHDTFGVNVRAEILGMNQRSLSLAVSSRDAEEAGWAGTHATKLVEEGISGVMVSFERDQSPVYRVKMKEVTLEKVLTIGERKLSKEFIDHPERYYEWLRPLVGEVMPVYPAPVRKEDNYVSPKA